MGRIKSTAIKRAARTLIRQDLNFNSNFEHNKQILRTFTLPDKGTRNKIAGYITRLKTKENSENEKTEKSLKTRERTNAQ